MELQGGDFIKTTNVPNVSLDKFEIPQEKESVKNTMMSKDSSLSFKIEEVLRRYAREIEAIILEHYKDKNV